MIQGNELGKLSKEVEAKDAEFKQFENEDNNLKEDLKNTNVRSGCACVCVSVCVRVSILFVNFCLSMYLYFHLSTYLYPISIYLSQAKEVDAAEQAGEGEAGEAGGSA